MTECPAFAWPYVRRIEALTGQTVDPMCMHEAWREIEELPTAAIEQRMNVAAIVGQRVKHPAQVESARMEYKMLRHEHVARRKGKVPPHMTVQGKREEHIRDRCDRIRQRVRMAEFITRETGIVASRQGRCPCPVHGGDGLSFSIKDERGKCFNGACAFSGDVIALAQELWHYDRPIEAIRRLDKEWA